MGASLVLASLMVLPVLALIRLDPGRALRWVGICFAVISAVTFGLYGHDKKRAESGGWRTPESVLHLLELLGGWPAAFIAQRYFRHKTIKTSYRLTFWLIVLVYQYASLDSLLGWGLTRGMARTIGQ